MNDLAIIRVSEGGLWFTERIVNRIFDECQNYRDIKKIEIYGNPDSEEQCKKYLNNISGISIVFFAHGGEDCIMGYGDRILIKYPENHNILKGLNIICFSCSSARILGEGSVEEGIVNVFLGFNERITWKKERIKERDFKTYVGKMVSRVLIISINNHYSFEKIRRELERELSSNLKEEMLSDLDITLNFELYRDIMNMVKAISLFGNVEIAV